MRQGLIFSQTSMKENEFSYKETSLEGVVDNVIFENKNFVIFNMTTENRLVTVTGGGSVHEGQSLLVHGKWVENARYGPQFKALDIRQVEPRSSAAIEAFFSGGAAKNMGKVFSKKIVKKFGDSLPDVLSQAEPLAVKSLMTVEGIGKKRASEIVRAWHEEAELRDLMDFVMKAGLRASDASRIKKAGIELSILRQDPYKVADIIPWAGFKKLDLMAIEAGLHPLADKRIIAASQYVLSEWSEKGGNTIMHTEEFLPALKNILMLEDKRFEKEILKTSDKELLSNARVKTGEILTEKGKVPYVASTLMYTTETFIADNISNRLGISSKKFYLSGNPIITNSNGQTISLSDSQTEAVKMALSQKVHVLSGGPGTGKTTIVKAYVTELIKSGIRPDEIVLCAPTGRAARRLSEATGLEASTIHRAIGVGRGEQNTSPLPILDAKVLIVDESSMIDIFLMKELLLETPAAAKILFVGDPFQLPSIGPGKVLGDLLNSDCVSKTVLSEVHRQGSLSTIPVFADSIKHGRRCEMNGAVSFSSTHNSEETKNAVVNAVKTDIFSGKNIMDIQVLTAMHKGPAGTISLNAALQTAILPQNALAEKLSNEFYKFHSGDKVLQRKNDYDKGVMNGEVGLVEHVDTRGKTLVVKFDDYRVQYSNEELENLQLAYAISVHKSQGGEYPKVIMVCDMSQSYMLERHLLYTGVTRSKEKIELIGQKQAFYIGENTVKSTKRQTLLSELLIEQTRSKQGIFR